MRRRIGLVILLLGCGVALPTSVARGHDAITGHVTITKVLTKKRVILSQYQFRGVSLPESKNSDSDPVSGELSRVVIYLDGAGLNRGIPRNATLTQKNRSFEPEIVVIPEGSTVSFPNEDPIFHNVFSLSKVKQFDLGYYPAGQTRYVKFDRPGIVQVYCHLHPDMSAAIVVLPTAWWTHPSKDGRYSLKDIPPGTYELVAWHRSAGFFRYRVSIRDGQTLTRDLVIPERNGGEEPAARGDP